MTPSRQRRLIAESSIDVAVLDVNLGSGHTSACIADSLKGAGTPFIFATGYGEMGLRSTDRDSFASTSRISRQPSWRPSPPH